VAITRQSLQLLRNLRVDIGTAADVATRDLAKAWVTAWDELRAHTRAAVDELIAAAVQAGRWPQPWELARVRRLQDALAASERALAQLGTRTGVVVSDTAGQVVGATVDQEPRLIASQLPAAEQAAAVQRFGTRIIPTVVDVMVARTRANIVNTARPLSGDAMDAMRRELVAGVAVGDNPRTSARNMVDRVEGAFNGGLSRAMTIARTEVLDAYRSASTYAHAANADVLSGWTWICACDRRSCASCWSKHGSTYPVTTPGPWDHPQGRCARMPTVRPWSELGINIPEPASLLPDAQSRFWSLPAADRLAIMGPARLELLRSGAVDWSDLAVRRTAAGWRDSFGPRSVADLNRIAGQRRAGGIAPSPHPLAPAEPMAAPSRVDPLRAAAERVEERLASAATGEDALASAAVSRVTSSGRALLSEAELRALYDYSGWNYSQINRGLRGTFGATLDKEGRALVRAADKALARPEAALARDVVVWRGSAFRTEFFGDRFDGDLTGFTWRDKAYTSTSASRRQAEIFATGERSVLMRILVPAGRHVVQLSGTDAEWELLLKRGLKFRVARDRGFDSAGRRLLDVEILP
jgi:hypothetical protein